jgi:phosphate transport system permease protein
MSAAPADTFAMSSPGSSPGDDVPRAIYARPSSSDRIFRAILRAAGIMVLVITGSILLFLILKSIPAFRGEGLSFFTTQTLQPPKDYGVAALLPETIIIALIALAVAFPAGLAAAIYISEYAPVALRRILIAAIDLMAAIPSIVFALWGLFFFMPTMLGTAGWMARHLGFIPIFHVPLPPTAASYISSPFLAGIVVGMLVTPIITSLSRQVFSQAPQGEREAAYALGATRWGMVRTVVLPFGRAGIIGSAMLGLGRALGETIVVTFLLVPSIGFTDHILQSGGNTITAEIALHVVDFGANGLPFLFASGVVLFVMTLIINSLAAIVINRSRSGAATAAD